jgi:hypothetical protein
MKNVKHFAVGKIKLVYKIYNKLSSAPIKKVLI